MIRIKVGDKLRVDEVIPGRVIVRNSYVGKVVKEYDHHFSVQSVNYLFSINKSSLIDKSLIIKRIRN